MVDSTIPPQQQTDPVTTLLGLCRALTDADADADAAPSAHAFMAAIGRRRRATNEIRVWLDRYDPERRR